MKLNFWQIIAVVLLIIGLGIVAYRKFTSKSGGPQPAGPTTQTSQPVK